MGADESEGTSPNIQTPIQLDIIHPTPNMPEHIEYKCTSPSGKDVSAFITYHEDGRCSLDVDASESGIHTIVVKWDGREVKGSPFLVRITHVAETNDDVTMYGDGLTSGVIDGRSRLFHINTGCTAGNLTVEVRGPKGGFDVRKSRHPTDERVVNVEYTPTLPGDYVVNVFWLGKHITGSPRELTMCAK